MWSKLISLVSVVLVLGLANGVSANTWTNADPNDELWSTPGNWDGGVPTGPDEGDTATLADPDVNGPLVRDGIDAVCVRFQGPGYEIPPGSDLTITGGTLTFGRYWRVGFGAAAGFVNISGGTVTNLCNYEIYMNAKSVFDLSDGLVNSGFYLPSGLSLGLEVSTLNMTGGTIDTKATPNTSHSMQIGVEGGGPGLLKLHGGTIITGTLHMGAKGQMDITEGTMTIDNDVTSTLEGYVNDGLITAYGGSGVVLYCYDDVNNVTVVSATSSTPSAYWPSPAHRAEDVCPDVVLSWRAGDYAASHEVYFGTDFNDVNDATAVHLGVYVGRQDPCEYDPPGLLEWNATYYWRVDEVNDACAPYFWRGQVWNFTVDSGRARNPSPMDLDWRMPVDVTLNWEPGCLANLHDVYLGTDFNDVNDADTTSAVYIDRRDACSYDPCGLEYDTTYYWRIDEVGNSTFVKGQVWSFATIGAGETLLMCDISVGATTLKEGWALMTKYEDYPEPGADDYGSDDGALTWSDVNTPDGSPTGIDVTLDVGESGKMGGRTRGGEPLGMDYFFANDQSGTPDADFIITLGDLTPGAYILTTFHNNTWYGYASGPVNEVTVSGGISYSEVLTALPAPQTESIFDAAICQVKVEFDATGADDVTIRYKPSETGVIFLNGFILDYFPPDKRYAYWPIPRDGAKEVPPGVVLSWYKGIYAADPLAHDVYFGTDGADVNDADTSSPEYKGSQSLDANTYNPPGLLELDTTYYWRIDERNDANGNLWKGSVWRFTTADYILLDDMESYCTGVGCDNDILDTWLDGLIWPPINYSGSVVDLGIAPIDPVHGDRQSMEYLYDNCDSWGWGLDYYSEMEVAIADLPIGPDWTASGVKALILYFYGQAGNDANATEQLYVGLEDSTASGHYTQVNYGAYAEDMNDIRLEEWSEWIVPLSDFSGGGVILTAVDMIYLGFGIRGNPNPGGTPGGTGTVYFDDLRLSLPKCVPSRGPAADLSGDCLVSIEDVGVMGEEWLNADMIFDVSNPGTGADLVGWWKLDEGNSNVANDSSTYANHGTVEGDYLWVADHNEASGGFALRFRNDGGKVRVPDAPILRPSTAVTAAAWVNYSEPWSYSARVVVKGADENNSESYALQLDDDRASWFIRSEPNGDNLGVEGAEGEVDSDEWVHLAGTYDGNTVKCYVNGRLSDSEDVGTVTILSDTNDLCIGNRADANDRALIGKVDDARVYNRALLETEIAWLATDGTGLYLMQSPANLYDEEDPGERAVNFRDYAVLMESWLEVKLWPPE